MGRAAPDAGLRAGAAGRRRLRLPSPRRLGACGGANVSYAAAREQIPLRLSGTATAFVNTAAVGSGAVLQPIVGLLLDANWDGAMANGAPVYSLAAFGTAFLTIPLSMALALLTAFLTRETFCRPPEA